MCKRDLLILADFKVFIRKAIIGITIVATLSFLILWNWFPSQKEPGYHFVQEWGNISGPGQLNEPIGIVISGNEVFVSDGGNHLIKVYNLNGNFLRSFGNKGDKLGELSRPMLMDTKDGKLYVAEYINDRIQVFSIEGESLEAIGSTGSGPGQFDSPGGVVVDEQGRLYVADFFNHRIQLLEPDGKFIKQYGKTEKKGIRAGLFNYPTDVALLSDGNLVVADAYNDRIQVFDPDGSFVRKWGGPFAIDIHGSFNGWFKTATAVAVGPKGNIFVADYYNHRIQKFTSEGKFLVSIGSKAKAPDWLKYPTDVAIDAEGNVYIVDFGNKRIQKFVQNK